VAVLACDAKLQEVGPGKPGLRLIGSDVSGGVWYVDGLTPGRYTIAFHYENKLREGPPATTSAVPQNPIPYWVGKVTTKEVGFEVAPGPVFENAGK
jgi:hypothetical protein